jgi:hypothetical protein
MSEGPQHHGGDTSGPQGLSGPGFQPGVFSPPEPPHQDLAGPSDLMPPPARRRRNGVRQFRPRAGSPAWVVQWLVALALLAFIVYVAFQVFHGATSTPSP